MDLGFSLNKYKNMTALESETTQGLLKMIQSIRCPVEVIQIYFDGTKHIAWIVSERKIIRKIKQE